MTPTDQEFIHAPEEGLIGDCQRAVIASLLDLPLSEVPHFLKESNGDTANYWERLQAFVRSHGFAWLVVPARSGGGFFGDDGDVYHEISGPSPRGNGVTHAVVGCNGEIVFDPHPSRAGLAGDSSEWEYAYLVRVTPAPGHALVPLSASQFGEEWRRRTGRIMGTDRELLLQAKYVTEKAHGIVATSPTTQEAS